MEGMMPVERAQAELVLTGMGRAERKVPMSAEIPKMQNVNASTKELKVTGLKLGWGTEVTELASQTHLECFFLFPRTLPFGEVPDPDGC